MSARERFKQRFGKHLRRVENAPLSPDGKSYEVFAYQPPPMEPEQIDWGFNRWKNVLDVIELKPGDPKIAELTGSGWEVSNLHKGSVQLILKRIDP